MTTALSNFYDLNQQLSCKLIRRSFNDHYLIKTSTQQFVLRVYINNKHYIKNIDAILFELDLLEYLYTNNISVVPPIRNINKKSFSTISLYEENRYIVLFPYAVGKQNDININKKISTSLGKIMAEIHLSANNFKSEFNRYTLDSRSLLEEPLNDIEKYMSYFGLGDLSFFNYKKRELMDAIKKIPINSETYGIIHGDPNPSNYHFSNKKGISLFDFDHCAYGYRIHDLSVMASCFPEIVFNQILCGYELIRPLTNIEKDNISAYSNILKITKFKDIFNMLEIRGIEDKEKKLVTQNAIHSLVEMVR